MTDILQPMDLVVNSMIKSFIRKKRIDMTMDYFQDFRDNCKRIQQRNRNAPLPSFNPPSPVLLDGLKAMFEIKDSFNNEKFQKSVKKIFHSVGLTPFITPSNPLGTFQTYAGVQTSGDIKKEVLTRAEKVKENGLEKKS